MLCGDSDGKDNKDGYWYQFSVDRLYGFSVRKLQLRNYNCNGKDQWGGLRCAQNDKRGDEERFGCVSGVKVKGFGQDELWCGDFLLGEGA